MTNMSIDTFLKMREQAFRLNSKTRGVTEKRPLILDLFCGAGGASVGYKRAGFQVVGVDIAPQPNYPCFFIQMNALDCDYEFLSLFDVIHASPPCQAYSVASAVARKQGKVYPDLVHPTRRMLIASGKPYIMENVPPAPMRPDICLDGSMFDLGVIRRRIFETNIPDIPIYPKPSSVEGTVIEGDYVTVAGKGGGSGSRLKVDWEAAMGIDWMSKKELTEAIPPAYTKWIGKEALLRLDELLRLEARLVQPPNANPRKLFVPKIYPVQRRLTGF